jgi:glycosyltransferase involved in cell wall biosynthesis
VSSAGPSAPPDALAGARIVLVNWRDPWHRLAGGSERYAWEFARALDEAGASVEFWTARDSGQSAQQVHEGIRVRRRGGAYGFYARALLGLAWSRLRRRAPDLVVDMDCGIPVFTPLVLSRRTPVVLVVHHIHQEQFRTAMRRPLSDLGRLLEGRAMPSVYQGLPTVAVSESTVEEMRAQLGWRGEVRVIHNGTDVPAEASSAPSDGERVVVFGRVVAHKRVDLVVRAFAELRERRPGVTLDVVGTGPELPTVADVVERLGLGSAVRLHGFLSESEKSRVLHAARLHVCASDAEGWGQVVLEAAAHGLPTLGRDVPGVRDSVRDGVTGWLVPATSSGDAEALRQVLVAGVEQALTRLSDPEVRVLMADDCREWASRFGWDEMRSQAVLTVVRALGERV